MKTSARKPFLFKNSSKPCMQRVLPALGEPLNSIIRGRFAARELLSMSVRNWFACASSLRIMFRFSASSGTSSPVLYSVTRISPSPEPQWFLASRRLSRATKCRTIGIDAVRKYFGHIWFCCLKFGNNAYPSGRSRSSVLLEKIAFTLVTAAHIPSPSNLKHIFPSGMMTERSMCRRHGRIVVVSPDN